MRSRLAYWVLSLAVTSYVALTTGYRDELIGIDAWEHHRAVRVLAEVGLHAGNPTYARDEPSIRYSPYTVGLALISRATGSDSYDVLSAAGVANTALLLACLYSFLASYRLQSVSAWVIGPMLFLYGVSPGYANSLAFEDLPVHQVNPSAFSLWLDLLSWTIWRATTGTRRLWVGAPACATLLSVSLLSHGMTGLLGGIGILAVSIADRERSFSNVGTAAITLAVTGAICLSWPWYSFALAIRSSPDPWFWYNPAILQAMLFVWCLPCSIAALLALPYRGDEIVRAALWGLGASVALGSAAIVAHSPTLARLPLAGLVFAQVLTGYVLWRWNLEGTLSLRAMVNALGSLDPAVFATGALRALLPAAIVYFAVPQVWHVLREPHLLRPRIAGVLGREPKQSHLLETYRRALAPVGETDVVLGDPVTSWPVPSVHGRVVAAFHLEFFVPGQRERWDQAEGFFRVGTANDWRQEVIRRYGVRWLLLDRDRNADVLGDLSMPPCTVTREGSLVLLDAHCWVEQSSNSRRRQPDP